MRNTPFGSDDRLRGRRPRYRATAAAASAVAVLALGTLVTAGPVGAASAAHRSTDHSPTLAVKPITRLVGDKSVHISGKYWTPGSDVSVFQCADQPATDPGSCTEELDEVPNSAGRWSVFYTPSVGEIQNSCVGQCYIEATDGTTDLVSTLTFVTPSVAIKPVTDNGYYVDERVTIDVRSFPRDNPVTIEICSGSIDNCDPDTAETKTANGAGDATFRGYGMDPFICSSSADECFMVAEDFTYANGPTEAVEQFVPYCGPIICPGLAKRRP